MRKRLLGMAVTGSLAISMLAMAAPARAAGDASLNVVHGIPGIDVNVCVNGAIAISNFNPGEVATGVPLPEGSYDFKIVALADDCTDAALLEATGVELAGGKDYTAIAHLMEDGSPALDLFRNNVRPVEKGTARLQVRHTAAAPAVDVWANGAVLVSDFAHGETATAIVPKGVYAAWASLPGDYAPVIGPAVLSLSKGFAYQVYAWGDTTSGYDFAVVAVKVGVK